VNHGLPELLQPRYDENHRGKMIFTGTQIQNDILLDLYLYIMNVYLVTKLNAWLHRWQRCLLPFALMMEWANQEDGTTTPMPHMDEALVTGLVGRWRPETHIFHLPFGKMTVTLKDVAMLTGLPIRGRSVVFRWPAWAQWQQYLQAR
jgi:hypothetical protein